MREIKFRVQAIDSIGKKYWIEFDLFKSFENPIAKGSAYGHAILPETVSQFTGLKDKNGKEIWENDIVKTNHCSWKEEIYISQVVFGIKAHGYTLKVDTKKYNKWGAIKYYSLPPSNNIEVIGNIFDNPELIK